jgi:hypothetical protein
MVENFEFNKVMRISHDLGKEWETGHGLDNNSSGIKLKISGFQGKSN